MRTVSSFVLLFLVSFQSAAAVYDCNIVVSEEVKVAAYEVDIPQGVDVDFGNGVPAEYVKTEKIYRPELLKDGFARLGYSYSGNRVTYTTIYHFSAVPAAVDTAQLLWNPNPGYEYLASMKVTTTSGIGQAYDWGYIFELSPTDTVNNSTGTNSLTIDFRGSYDKRTDKSSLSIGLSRFGREMIFMGNSSVSFRPERDKFLEFELSLATGYNYLATTKSGDGKSDGASVSCQRR